MLHERGIVAIPDFVSNSGGVHLYDTVAQDMEPDVALPVIEEAVPDAVARVLATAEKERITPSSAALREAREYLAQGTSASRAALVELFAA